jgi:hypothetical protein
VRSWSESTSRSRCEGPRYRETRDTWRIKLLATPIRRYTRRSLFGGAVGLFSAASGLLRISRARAATIWYLTSPMYGSISQSWHSNALDIQSSAGSVSVWSYFRRGSVAYGYVEIRAITDSCSTAGNPLHRIVNFYVRTDGPQSYVGNGYFSHVEAVGVAQFTMYACPKWIAQEGTFVAQVKNPDGSWCYTGRHIHYYANGAQVGFHPYGESTYLDSPIMWQWTV